MLAAAASSAAAAQTAATELTTHYQQPCRPLPQPLPTMHYVHHLTKPIIWSKRFWLPTIRELPQSRQYTCHVCWQMHHPQSSRIKDPLQSSWIKDYCVGGVTDARHFIKDTPQGELPAKVPHSFKTSHFQGEWAEANYVWHIPANMMTLPPEAKLLESHQLANMPPSTRGHTRDSKSINVLIMHTGWQESINFWTKTTQTASLRSKGTKTWTTVSLELECENRRKMRSKLHQWVSRRELVD